MKRIWMKFRGLKTIWQVVIAGVVVLVVAAAIAGPAEEEPSPAASSPAGSTATTAADVDATSTTTESTTTTTEAPTTTTTQPPTTTTAPPQPTVYEGSGDDVIAITKPESVAIAVFSHNGSSNFIVTGLDANRERVAGLVNEIGSWVGSVPLDLEEGAETAYMEIQAGGAWRVELQPLSMARKFDGSTTGRGTEFFAYQGSGGIAHWTHNGSSNFIVTIYTSDGRDGLVNEIGPYDGRVSMDGPGYLEVVADGEWSVTVE